MVPAAVLALVALRAVHAAPALSFEQSLGEVRRQVIATKAQQARARSRSLAGDIESLARDARTLAWDSSRLRSAVSDLRRRAQRHAPDQPGRPSQDPFFRSDLDRAVWSARDLARDSDWALRRARRISSQATKDPALVAPAEDLSRQAGSLESEARWLENEARWASWDIRRAGYNMEAWDLERESGNVARASRDLQSVAREILTKVR